MLKSSGAARGWQCASNNGQVTSLQNANAGTTALVGFMSQERGHILQRGL